MAEEVPESIGKYKVLGVVAKGGMGVVYKAVHPSLNRQVVIKKLTARSKAGNAERFKKEAQILLDLQSPYIVHLFDYFAEGGFRYMVEELVDGEALDTLIKKQTALPVPLAMLVLQDACFALKFAHSREIVHRDIKPGNILISKRGEVKLADFGIASDSEGDSITKTGAALGTPAYMPPEQFEDVSKVDRRADIYALGISLYEMLTGTKPYPGTFSLETLNIIKKGKYISPRKIDKTIPRSIERLIHKMLRPKARQRYQNVDGVLKVVKRFLRHYDKHEIRIQLAKSVQTPRQYAFAECEPKDKKARRIRRIIVVAAAVVLLLCGCWKAGLIHRTVLRGMYTPVQVSLLMPASLSGNMDLPARAFFFENDNDKIPEVNGSRRNFAPEGSRFSEKLRALVRKSGQPQDAGKNRRYTMQSVFLRPGDYRVKVVVGPYVWWKSFSADGGEVILECDFLKNMRRKLKIVPVAYDSGTGAPIAAPTEFRLLHNNTWKLISEVNASEITSAAVQKIMVSAEGYESETFSLLIDWFQDEVVIEAALRKK